MRSDSKFEAAVEANVRELKIQRKRCIAMLSMLCSHTQKLKNSQTQTSKLPNKTDTDTKTAKGHFQTMASISGRDLKGFRGSKRSHNEADYKRDNQSKGKGITHPPITFTHSQSQKFIFKRQKHTKNSNECQAEKVINKFTDQFTAKL